VGCAMCTAAAPRSVWSSGRCPRSWGPPGPRRPRGIRSRPQAAYRTRCRTNSRVCVDPSSATVPPTCQQRPLQAPRRRWSRAAHRARRAARRAAAWPHRQRWRPAAASPQHSTQATGHRPQAELCAVLWPRARGGRWLGCAAWHARRPAAAPPRLCHRIKFLDFAAPPYKL
jgi:hypothetical protein